MLPWTPMRAPEFWRARGGPMAGMIAGLLAPLGTAWDTAGRLHRALARPYRATVAVICVGNLVGPVRESVAMGLARADAIVLLGDGAEPGELRAAGRPIFRADLMPLRGENLAGATLVAFAGIGRPEKFVASLRKIGAQVVAA